MLYDKAARFAVFLHRLAVAPPASSLEEAFSLLCNTLNGTEDELSSIPFNPDNWQTDGRLYPPNLDNRRDVAQFDAVKRFRSLAHNTFIAANGAIEIQSVAGSVVIFRKAGANGLGVWDKHMPQSE